ncbi:MAG: fibronectin type III domain-containing protein [Acidimicrobiales bacterium]
MTRVLAVAAIAVGVLVPAGLSGPEAGAAATSSAPAAIAGAFPVGQIIYPDLVSVIPATDLAISQPTPTTREFNYEHVMYNAGGPLEVQPVNYDPATNLAGGIQNLYSYTAAGDMVLEQQVPVPDKFFYHSIHGHFHFPLASFGLYSVKADGSLGQPVALSPKNGFCIADTNTLDPSLPGGYGYSGATCGNPTAVRGIAPGRGDLYNRDDPGQAIDITGLADGVYWFHTVADPNQNFVDANRSNNVTDIKVKIVGTTVTPLSSMVSQGNFIIDQSAVVDGQGPQSTPPITTAAPGELIVATVSSDGPAGTAQTATVSGGGLSWTLARRTNTQAGTAEVWTAMATNPLTNAVITSTTSQAGYVQSLTVHAIKGASGIGASVSASGASGPATASLSTTAAGSWVMGVGVDPNHWIQRTLKPGQSMVHEWLAENQGNSTSWVQATPAPTPTSGTPVTSGSSYPTADPWNLTQFEILPAVQTDFTAPVISSPTASNIGPDYAHVGWATDEVATTQVAYGPTPGYGQTTALDPTLVTAHDAALSGLTPSTTYFCELRSRDSSGNLAQQGGFSFTTTPPRTTPAVFSNVRVTDIQPDQVTVAWTTDETTDGQVEFGTTTAYGSASPRSPDQVTSHFILVNNLLPSTTYHYRVNGTDAYGNSGVSEDHTFTTPGVPPPIVVDKTVSVDGKGAVTSPAITTTAADDLLVAFVSSDGPTTGGQTATVTGAGLTWTLARRTNTQLGTSEVWSARASSILTNVTVRSTQGTGGFDQALTVVAFKGAVGIGKSVSAWGANGPPTATFNTQRSASLVYAVGNDWDSATGRTVGPNQSLVHQFVDTGAGDTFWTQALNGPAGPVESVITLNDTAPTADQWNFSMVEIVRPVSIPASPPVVSGVAASAIGTTAATIVWNTDVASSSQVAYGPTSAYGSTSPLDASLVTSHSVTLTGLTPGTTYHYKATSANSVGPTSSGDGSFTTLTADTTAPTVVAVTPANGTSTVPITSTLSATFSEPVQPASIAMTVRTGANVPVAGTVSYDAATRVATFTPTSPLPYLSFIVGTISAATDLAGNPLAAPVNWLFATVPQPAASVTVDKTVFKDGRNSATTSAFTTSSANEVVLAFVSGDGPKTLGQTATVSGGGLTWTLVRRANAQAGTSEVWKATAPAVLTNATVKAALTKTGFDVSLTVVTFSGASGVGANAGASVSTGAPSVNLTTTAAGSRVYGVDNDWDAATARTVGAGQSMVHQWVDTAVGDTFWTQCVNAASAAAGAVVTVNDTAPTADRSNFVAVEIIP